VSGIIRDSMDDILQKVHEAGLTLKAGCVAPGTLVRTERGLVTADLAVAERHREILSYDCESGEFEMRPILRHLTTRVPREENIRITSNQTKCVYRMRSCNTGTDGSATASIGMAPGSPGCIRAMAAFMRGRMHIDLRDRRLLRARNSSVAGWYSRSERPSVAS
jgi:hypothetical protein